MRKLAILFASAILLALAAATAKAQDDKHESQLRTVRGFVVDKSDSPVSGGIVYLKNLRTNQIRSYISENDGRYRFSGLDPNADYEVHAEKDGAKSTTKTVSSFDSRKDIVLTLKIEKRKG
ncbi:MAG TPA: carboxypeptidase-like regulatory domain-containing protein [Candidatus Acidoferrum sp.]|nr:carboxypeptidase-like regulatory domain-containing protein [Candidatus Acidoferrum sp.]